MKNFLTKIKKDKNIILSFFLPIFIFLTYFIIYKINYKDFFVADLQEQYSNFFYYYKDVLNGNASIFYSFYKGLGGSMLGTFIYYLSSPLNLFLIFVPKHYIQLFIVVLIFFKIGISSMTMYIFLKNHFKEKINLIFPLCYSISGYVIMYYFNIMWLDIVYLAPLVLLGIDKMIEKNDVKYYVIFLFLSIISNIYISFMLCIFCVIYFFYQYFLLKIKDKKKIVLFFKSSLITGLLCSFIIIPFIFELSNVYRLGKGTSNSFTIIIKNFFEMLSSFFLNLPDKQMSYWNPNLYFSIFMFILVILYFFNNNINKRKKKISFVFMLLFILSYSVPFINYIWHGMSNIMIYGYRYSFLITIFLILISYESLKNIRFLNIRELIYGFIIVFGFYIASIIYLKDINSMFIFNLFFIISYIIVINIIRKYNNKYYILCLSLIIIIELFINVKTTFVTNKNLKKPFLVYDEKYKLCEKLSELSAFRIEGEVFNTNENLICGYGKISEFNTMNDKLAYDFFEKANIGLKDNYVANNLDKIMNYILGIKYIYTIKKSDEVYELEDNFYVENKKYNIYKNDVLSIGFAFNEHKYDKNIKNSFEFQNSFTKYLTGLRIYENDSYKLNNEEFNKIRDTLSKEQLKNIRIYKNKLEGKINVSEDKTLFLSIPYNDNFTIYVDNKKTSYRKLFDAFLGVDLKKGNHKIKIIYFPKYIYYGIFLSSITLEYLLLKMYINYKKINNNSKKM